VGRVGMHRRVAGLISALLVATVLSGCAERVPSPLPVSNGRAIVLGPEPGFDPDNLSHDWFLAPEGENGRFRVVDLSGTNVLRLEDPGGPLLGRRIAMSLLAAPYLHAGWYLDPGLYGGGPLDGLPRGLRLVIAFEGGTPGGAQLLDRMFPGDLPPYDRSIELRFGGIGAAHPEEALIGLTAVSDQGIRRVLRPPEHGQAGRWHLEAIDLAALYRGFWPRDRIGQ